ncbi:hypothetical protein Sjap_016555 [Stephania japonica]|uniref:Uncharacterized protein n=1 Tax=Stephania japonica TaxID=461633 RepID=A0AAP0NSH9_9MAGN
MSLCMVGKMIISSIYTNQIERGRLKLGSKNENWRIGSSGGFGYGSDYGCRCEAHGGCNCDRNEPLRCG